MPITQTVGENGANLRKEVQYVQALLNVWRTDNQIAPLDLDGKVGPQTKGAIRQFQTAVTGKVDGVISPSGPAIEALEAPNSHLFAEIMSSSIIALLLSYEPPQVDPPPIEEPIVSTQELNSFANFIHLN